MKNDVNQHEICASCSTVRHGSAVQKKEARAKERKEHAGTAVRTITVAPLPLNFWATLVVALVLPASRACIRDTSLVGASPASTTLFAPGSFVTTWTMISAYLCAERVICSSVDAMLRYHVNVYAVECMTSAS